MTFIFHSQMSELDEKARIMKKILYLPSEIDDDLIKLAILRENTSQFVDINQLERFSSKYDTGNYESLEFLGDFVLGYIVKSYIYEHYGGAGPGIMSDISHHILSNKYLQNLMISKSACTEIPFFDFSSNITDKHPVCADVFEALVGAIYHYYRYERADEEMALKMCREWIFGFWGIQDDIKKIAQENMEKRKETRELILKKKIESMDPEIPFKQYLDRLRPALRIEREKMGGLYNYVVILYGRPEGKLILADVSGENPDITRKAAVSMAVKKLQEMEI